MRAFPAISRWFVITSLCLTTLCPAAEPPLAGANLAQRYPASSIQTPEAARRALAEVSEARTKIQAEYAQAERQCQEQFFVNRCMAAAREQRRLALEPLSPIEVEANRLLRRHKAEEREAAQLRKELERDAKREERAVLSLPADNEQTENDAFAAAQRARETPAPPEQEAVPVKQNDNSKAAADDARKREANIAAYERKQQAALERQRKLAERKAQKQRAQAAKAASEKSD